MCFCDCNDNIPKVFEVTHPKARKQHTCCECGSIIDQDEQHECARGLWDEGWDTFRTCIACAQIREAAMAASFESFSDMCFPFEHLYECVGYDYEEAACSS